VGDGSHAVRTPASRGASAAGRPAVLHGRSGLARMPAVRAQIRRALNTGLDPVLLADIMNEAGSAGLNSSRLAGYLTELGKLRNRGIPGVDAVLSDLARGGNWTAGAEWVLRYLDAAPRGRSWGGVRHFEAVLRTKPRIWAARGRSGPPPGRRCRTRGSRGGSEV
jgi:hypothetical protein